MKNRTRTAATLAKKYGCTARTIRSWRAENAPLHSPARMRAWLAGRKNIPPGLAVATEQGEPSLPGTIDAPEATGAAGALHRLERAEVSAYSRLQAALKRRDPLAIKTCREGWLHLTDQLRHFERAISDDKRHRGLLVSRTEIETALAWLGYAMRLASESIAPQLTTEMSGSTDLHRFRNILRRTNYATAVVGFSCLKTWGVPGWLIEALSSDLRTNPGVTTTAQLEEFGNFIAGYMAETAADIFKDTPPTDARLLPPVTPPGPPAAQ